MAIAGKWTYRSYLNNPELVDGNAQTALSLIFGEGVFTFETPTPETIIGTLDMGGGYVLDLKGKIIGDCDGPVTLVIDGYGRDGTPTAGWEYDYHAWPGYEWPDAVDQVPSLLGTTVRAKPHNGEPAGVTASFIAVRQ
ncbi:hypothetical protein [Caulobacter hibisci]|uniref:Lipocalin-like domain-containing protein n=1 Tax=Caulobacter hibisci TaxID=2035993 RepID=A0ABS0SW92_9CAUL|nr:hypothetical protein [Caulobacter hibisci]MBI1683858.1 hypothetical protein [Caulobacter hibisci]